MLLKALFFVSAVPALLRAAFRVVACRRLPFDEAAARLRTVPPFAWGWMRQPELLAASVDRVLVLLPPWTYGRCLRRSLLLLDLWSRCGLDPRLHLGFGRERSDPRRGHAWLSARDGRGRDLLTPSHGFPEAFTL